MNVRLLLVLGALCLQALAQVAISVALPLPNWLSGELVNWTTPLEIGLFQARWNGSSNDVLLLFPHLEADFLATIVLETLGAGLLCLASCFLLIWLARYRKHGVTGTCASLYLLTCVHSGLALFCGVIVFDRRVGEQLPELSLGGCWYAAMFSGLLVGGGAGCLLAAQHVWDPQEPHPTKRRVMLNASSSYRDESTRLLTSNSGSDHTF